MIRKSILSIALLMLVISTVLAEPTASNFGVTDAQGNQSIFVLVPVNITNAQNGPIAGIVFDISFNSSVINLTSANVNRGDLTSGWDSPVYNPATGLIQFVYGGSGTEIPDGVTGSVIILKFSIVGSPGSKTNMSISGIQLSDLNGSIGTAPAKNGIFVVANGIITTSAPMPTSGSQVNVLATVPAPPSGSPAITPSAPASTSTSASSAPFNTSTATRETPNNGNSGQAASIQTPVNTQKASDNEPIKAPGFTLPVVIFLISYIVLKTKLRGGN